MPTDDKTWPSKVVRIGHDKQQSAADQTCGMLYAAEKVSDALSASPPMTCPCCGEPASGAVGVEPKYRLPGGKPVPPCPVDGLDYPTFVYAVEPCGCRVSAEWSAAFQAELNHRIAGGKPGRVVDMSPAEREAKRQHLTKKLTQLYVLQSAAVPDGSGYVACVNKEAVDYWIVIVVDQLQRLLPSNLNMASPKPLSPAVDKWAKDNGHAVPEQKAVAPVEYAGSKWPSLTGELNAKLMSMLGVPKVVLVPPPPTPVAGTPMYARNDGTYGTTPAYPGQQPSGFAQPSHASGWGSLSADAAVKSGVHPDDDPAEVWITLNKYGTQNKNLDTFTAQYQGGWKPQEKPEVGLTKAGQWFVRHGDIYKVFVEKVDADNYAEQLVSLTPGFASKMTQPEPEVESVSLVADNKVMLVWSDGKHSYMSRNEAVTKAWSLKISGSEKAAAKIEAAIANHAKAGGKDAKKAAHIQSLKNTLKACGPDEFPAALIEKIHLYGRHNVFSAGAMHAQIKPPCPPPWPSFRDVQDELYAYVTAKGPVKLSEFAVLYVHAYLDMLKPEPVETPSPSVPPDLAAPAQRSDPITKKRRSIKKLED